MRLLLDEHFSKVIAEQLRGHGHDVLAVTERDELRGLSDEAILDAAIGDQRALVTQNVADFAPLLQEAALGGGHHYGIVFTSARTFPRTQAGVGPVVAALDALLREFPHDDSLQDRTHWLSAPTD